MRQLASDQGFLHYSSISKIDRAGSLIFGLVLVSRDFGFGMVCPSVCTFIHPQKVSSILMKFSVYVEVDE